MVFAARRAGAEQELRGHPKTVLAGLNGEESQSLLMSVLPGPLDEYVKDNLLAEAKGNPLALLELHRALTPAELAGGYGLATATNPHALESSFCRRLSALPRQTLLLLLLAAADPAGRPDGFGRLPSASASRSTPPTPPKQKVSSRSKTGFGSAIRSFVPPSTGAPLSRIGEPPTLPSPR